MKDLRDSELPAGKVPAVWEQQPDCETQGCGRQQLFVGGSQDTVGLFVEVCEARYSQESPHLFTI